MSAEAKSDSVEKLAADLRELRASAGHPTLLALARRTGISKSVLSDAFAGKRLPTERTVAAVVGEFAGDVEAFVGRRAALEWPAPTGADSSSGSAWTGSREPVTTREGARADVARGRTHSPGTVPRTVRLAAAAWIAVAAAVAGGLAGAAATSGLQQRTSDLAPAAVDTPSPTSTATANGARIVVSSGEDPAQTVCVEDAAVAASETRADDSLLEIIWSDACQAGWARITRYDGAAEGNAVSASIFRQVAPDAADRQDTTEPGVQGAYTTLLVRPTPETRLCATGEITRDGEHVDLGDPMCL